MSQDTARPREKSFQSLYSGFMDLMIVGMAILLWGLVGALVALGFLAVRF